MDLIMYNLFENERLVGYYTGKDLIAYADSLAQDEDNLLIGELITSIDEAIRFFQEINPFTTEKSPFRVELAEPIMLAPSTPPGRMTDFEILREAFEKIGYPFIAHERGGTGAKNIVLCNDESDVRAFEANILVEFPEGPRFEFNYAGQWMHVWH